MTIDKYLEFTTQKELDYIKKLAANVAGLNINVVVNKLSTGGVATMKDGLTPLLTDLGVNITYTELNAPSNFIVAVNRFYTAMANPMFQISDADIKTFEDYAFPPEARRECDICLVEGLHPLALAKQKDFCKKIVWRCHGDFSSPNAKLLSFLKPYIEAFDCAVFTLPSFFPHINVNARAILPSIDPLAEKNRPLSEYEINEVYSKYNISRSKTVIFQLGRFDVVKDPLGVLDVFEMLKKEEDVTLVLAGYLLDDTQESADILRKCRERAANMKDVHILLLENNDFEINALQRGADIVLQKSIKEAFGMAVTESLWKEKPVVASATGGLALQVMDGVNGLLCNSKQTCLSQIKKLLRNPAYARDLARAGKQNVKDNMLITRHVRDIFQTFNLIMGKEEQ